jgi:hypothetical protein
VEPTLQTAESVLPVLEELKRREPLFHKPEFGTTRLDFEAMLDAGFWEVGASGRRYSREYALDILERRVPDPAEETWETDDFFCRGLGEGVYLLTYTLLQGSRITRRATLWQQTEAGWKALYHQGTMVDSAL